MKIQRTVQVAFVLVFIILTLNEVSTRYKTKSYKPVVLIHGFLADKGELTSLDYFIKKTHPGTVVTVINAYNSIRSAMPMWKQIEQFANVVQNISMENPNGINMIGYSQGGLIGRAVLEVLPNHNVHTFISLAAPQMGMYGVPETPNVIANYLKKNIHLFTYSNFGQHFSFGGYWRDPNNLEEYKNRSEFLPYINNEVNHEKQDEYKRNFASVQHFVLLSGPDDGVIKPWTSGLFGYVDANGTQVDITEQEVYVNDTFGLKTLDKRQGLHLYTVPHVTHYNWYKNFTIYEDYIEPWLT